MSLIVRELAASAKLTDMSNDTGLQGISEAIGSLFSTLANMQPDLALYLLEQMNEQVNQSIVDQMEAERLEHFNMLVEAVVIPSSDPDELN